MPLGKVTTQWHTRDHAMTSVTINMPLDASEPLNFDENRAPSTEHGGTCHHALSREEEKSQLGYGRTRCLATDRVHAAANRLPDALHRRLRTGDVVHARRRGREVDRKRTFVDHFRWRKNWTRPTTRRFMRLTPNRGLTTACTKNL